MGSIYPLTLHTAVYLLKAGRNFYERQTRPGTFRPYLESSPGRKDLGGNRRDCWGFKAEHWIDFAERGTGTVSGTVF